VIGSISADAQERLVGRSHDIHGWKKSRDALIRNTIKIWSEPWIPNPLSHSQLAFLSVAEKLAG
jgi:hypothetical protein